ncbi:hypothetical protein G1H11_18080 [Phytoactinopolyspora alkaliphila]|uniref:Alpha/beta fold hydrolase n=1 Tax=Phytoactinopolyspora alkaliphila TaxID=1783498 RepID=A0A6N9YQ82_9ACTN|nr:lipase family protein [Phytoactinopolyspora alkaliphila]NED97211.1 hypothetical protein [Phytoactinopolyspora alkaliphila]
MPMTLMPRRPFAAIALLVGALLCGLAAPAAARPMPAPPSDDDAYCDEACQWALQQQHENAITRTSFYDPPDPLPDTTMGTLLRQEPGTGYDRVSVEMAITRILYVSADSAGRPVAAAGVVLTPTGEPPRGGWPVILHAHGVSGMGQACAPSLMRDLYHGDQIERFVEQGWAVVAPDYAGLGTDGRHEVGNKAAAANDVLSALEAARRAVPGLHKDWILWGHSQGGAAVLASAERLANRPMAGYRGAMVTSPPSDLHRVIAHTVAQPGLGVFPAALAKAAHVSDRRVRLDRVLTQAALDRLPIADTGCLGAMTAVYSGLTGSDLVVPRYLSEPHFRRFLEENRTGRNRIAGPLLLLQGEADTVVPLHFTDDVAKDLCRRTVHVDYRTYPGIEHDTYPGWVVGITDAAMPDMLDWAAARFGGEPATSSCAS